jgi:hypothetical protein
MVRLFDEEPSRRLPVAAAPPDGLLVDSSGRPVWPVTAPDRSALHELGKVFGFSLEEVSATRSELEPAGGGAVVALGAESAPAARLYAHLTGRSWAVVEDAARLPPPDRFDVLVMLEDCLTSTLLDGLYAPHLSRAPGVLCSNSVEGLRSQVLMRSAAGALGGDGTCRRVDVLPVVDIATEESPSLTVLGARSRREDLISALSDGQTVLTVFTHSDGVDADLGPQLVMCPLDRAWESDPAAGKPTCQVTRQCYRLKVPLDDLVGSTLLLHPDRIAARAFIFNACIGVMPADSNVDPAFSLGARLLRNHRIGAMLTSWRPTICTPYDTELLSRLLLDGVPIGTAVARHNAMQASLQTGHRFGLFGDPALRVVPREDAPAQEVPRSIAGDVTEDPRLAGAPSRPVPGDQVTLLKACLGGQDHPRVGSSLPLSAIPNERAAALNAIEAYEAASRNGGDPGGIDERAGCAMRRAIADLVARRGRFCDLWLQYAAGSKMLTLAPRCRGCSNSTILYEIALKLDGVEPRHLEICSRCGFTRDVPRGFEMALHVHEGRVLRLEDNLPDDRWAGALTVQYRWPLPTDTWPWPSAPNGAPARELVLPEDLRPVPVVITVTLLVGTQIFLTSRAVRGAPLLSLRDG